MQQQDKRNLSALYAGSDIDEVWQSGRNLPLIEHPTLGKISPNQYRAHYHLKPCPFCGQKMVHGQSSYATKSKQEAIGRGYQYQDANGNNTINRVGNSHNGYIYFHPHYVTLDHKLNKARCPERMFDTNNLQAMCWKCNNEKGDNNAYELQHSLDYMQSLAQETLNRYPSQ
ncbi:hypothetical protein [Acaryochloris marina]|uniref:hypothetical protein n=1 Tax=Acaryochloris marina TaxID=155978 RepID=UPI0021C3F08A|nr:hypothetical protein [Acaryochloris marina]BDM83915.1 hypothetical protein AM10699_67760 [Acaryochloris marina MBIC10699]